MCSVVSKHGRFRHEQDRKRHDPGLGVNFWCVCQKPHQPGRHPGAGLARYQRTPSIQYPVASEKPFPKLSTSHFRVQRTVAGAVISVGALRSGQ